MTAREDTVVPVPLVATDAVPKETPASIAQGRIRRRPPVSVIDIGSNSVRLLVYEGASRSPTPLFNEKVMCGLGRAVAAEGKLEGGAADRALAALRRFRYISQQLGAGKPWILATAAAREASNGAEFIAKVEEATGARVMLLSGQREGELAAAGILAGFEKPDGIGGDLGGGSLELVDVPGDRQRRSITLPLGGLRLAQRCGGDLAKAEKLIDQDFDTVPWITAGANRSFYAVGGTWRSIAKHHLSETSNPLQITHAYTVEREAAIRYCELVEKGKRAKETATDSRKDVLPLGAIVLRRLLQRMKPKQVVFSAFGIREGLLYTLQSRTEQVRDPLIAFCEDYALLRSRSPEHATELCAWTDVLFQPPGPAETPEQRRLRHAVCILSDIAWRSHPDYRGEQALNTIVHSALIGVDHPGRAFLALAVYYRHARDLADSPLGTQLATLLSKPELKRARTIGAAIRVAHMMSVGAAAVIPRVPPVLRDGKLQLTLPADLAVLDGERLRKRHQILAELLEVKADLRIAG